jgi:hypothetical protein
VRGEEHGSDGFFEEIIEAIMVKERVCVIKGGGIRITRLVVFSVMRCCWV